jgi:hypothetical protein
MSSILGNTTNFNEMPPGFHFSRILALSATLPEQQRRKVAESAKALISDIPVDDDAYAEVHSIADRLTQLLLANPQMTEAEPGGCYWPMRVIVDRARDAGIEIDLIGMGGSR